MEQVPDYRGERKKLEEVISQENGRASSRQKPQNESAHMHLLPRHFL